MPLYQYHCSFCDRTTERFTPVQVRDTAPQVCVYPHPDHVQLMTRVQTAPNLKGDTVVRS